MAKKGKFVVRKVPATTNNTTRAIINFLLSEGHSASRINTTGIYDEKIGGFRKSGSRKGFADIAATLAPNGRSLAVEVKFSVGDELSDDQEDFRDEHTRAGGIFLEVESYAEFLAMYHAMKGIEF